MQTVTKNRIIGLDMDGVIMDYSVLKRRLAMEAGFDIRMSDANSDIMDDMIPHLSLIKIKQRLYQDPTITLVPPLFKGAFNSIKKIKESGYPYFLISRRKSPEIATRVLAFHKLWPDYFSRDNTFFVEKKTDKNIVAKKLKITHYVDDQPSVLKELNFVSNKILFDSTRSFTGIKEYKRVTSWKDLSRQLLKS